MDQENRVVVLIDMDCFYCQVEEKLNPELKGKPIAVVQYNPWKGGGIIAVNYVARALGVTRHMRGDEAKEKCPEIQLPSVPCHRGKADITKYRDAGKEVAKVLQKFTSLLERASIDEAYLDITATVAERMKTLNVNTVSADIMPNTYALGYDSLDNFIADVHSCSSDSIDFDYDHVQRLLVGAVIVSEIRCAVYEETGYRCSAGIAHNKILAKLVCGMNKPNKQTILPKHSINILYKTLPIKKVKHLGGKFGDSVCEVLKIKNMSELQQFSEKELQAKFDEKNGTWLYNIARGTDLEPVQARFNPKSIGCCKQFRGKSALITLESLKKWLKDLGAEIEDRLEKDALENNRTPKQLVVSFSTQLSYNKDTSSSRSYNFVAEDELCGELFSKKAFELILENMEGTKLEYDEEINRQLKAPIKFLGISVGKFEDNSESKKTRKFLDYFGASTSRDIINDSANQTKVKNLPNEKTKSGKEYLLEKFLQQPKQIEKKEEDSNNKYVLESPLDKQESFFAKFLTRDLNKDILTKNEELGPPTKEKDEKKSIEYPTTLVCNVVNCEDDSNDTEYSGSTINMEINKSIALFEEDPQDISRVADMRKLLDSVHSKTPDITEVPSLEKENPPNDDVNKNHPQHIETFKCTECGKVIPLQMFETHADYHLALKLREEERQRLRDENKQKSKVNTECKGKKTKEEDHCNETVSSITSFLVKFDNATPTEKCSQCGIKVPLIKLREHLDFHEAQRLNRELNRKSAPTCSDSSTKRKRKTVASPMKKIKLPCRSIDSFFR